MGVVRLASQYFMRRVSRTRSAACLPPDGPLIEAMPMTLNTPLALVALCLPLLASAAAPATKAPPGASLVIRQPYPGAAEAQPGAAGGGRKISYHGGPVMTSPLNTIYVIYYGSFPDTGARNDTVRILNDFFSHIGGSPAYNVNSTYTDGNGAPIPNVLAFDPATTVYNDAYSMGKAITDKDIPTIVKRTIKKGRLPLDENAIYFIVTSPDATGGLRYGCAWHDGSTTLIPGHTLKYSSIPVYTGTRLNSCSGNVAVYHETNSPNDNLEADNALDSFMHELSEAVSDPLPPAGWVTASGAENGDLCNFNYGAAYVSPNGTHASVHLGDRDYLVQAIWQNTGKGFCANGL